MANVLEKLAGKLLVVLESISGYKTYIAAAGLAGLALYQISQGDIPGAYQSLMTALGAAGVRHAVSKAAGK